MADKLTREELEKMRRVDLRQEAVRLGMSNTECSEAQSQKLIDFILENQDGGGGGGKKGGKAEEKPARGRRGRTAEPEPEEDDEDEDEEEEEEEKPARGRGRGRPPTKKKEEPEEEEDEDDDDDEEEEEEKPAARGRRGRGRVTEEEEAEEKPARGRGRGRRSAPAEEEVEEAPAAAASGVDMSGIVKRLDAIGAMQDENKKDILRLAKKLYVTCGLVQEIMAELKIPDKDIDTAMDDLEEEFEKGNG